MGHVERSLSRSARTGVVISIMARIGNSGCFRVRTPEPEAGPTTSYLNFGKSARIGFGGAIQGDAPNRCQ